MKLKPMIWLLIIMTVLLSSCEDQDSSNEVTASEPTLSPATLRIVSGSENETLEPIIMEWSRETGNPVQMEYLGSVDISRLLQTGSTAYDAVWPANSLWLNYGDTHNLVQHAQSIMRSPVVLAVKRPVAEGLGWVDADVTMNDILEAAERGDLRFMMTSATQSNSGASFFFAALSAFADSPEVLTQSDLDSEAVQEQITRILGTVNRSSGSSGWLKNLFLETYQLYDGMVNYEALIIETNQELQNRGEAPLYAIYPVDGLAIADSPLGFVRTDNNLEKEEVFLELQEYLLSEATQQQLLSAGRRAGLIGLQVDNSYDTIFNPEWGIDVNRTIQPIRFPNSEVINNALNLYQTVFRKPSCTVIAVDRSGSMQGVGEENANAGLRTLLNQNIAEQYLLQAHEEDRTTIILFNRDVINNHKSAEWTVTGNDPTELNDLYLRAEAIPSGGDTNIFGTVQLAHEFLLRERSDSCLPAIILMTDGQDNISNWETLQTYLQTTENDIPIFIITFGDANDTQVIPIVEYTFGRIFDGRSDLVAAFRKAKGYN